MPADPVCAAVVATVGEHVLRLLHQVIVWLRHVRDGVARVAHRQVFTGSRRRCWSWSGGRWCGEIADLNVINIESICSARDFPDFEANRTRIVNGEGSRLQRRGTTRDRGANLSPTAAVVGGPP